MPIIANGNTKNKKYTQSELNAPFENKNILTQSNTDPTLTGIGYISDPNTLSVLQVGGVSAGGWFQPFASNFLGKGEISGYSLFLPDNMRESIIGCNGTHYLNSIQADSLIEIDAKTNWELTSKGLPMPIVDYEYIRGAWGINYSAKAFSRNNITYMPMSGQGVPQLRYTCKYESNSLGTHYQTDGLEKGSAHVIILERLGSPVKIVMGAYPSNNWYIGEYKDAGAASWNDIPTSPVTANPLGFGIEWSNASDTNLRTCFAMSLMPSTMTNEEIKIEVVTGLQNWESEYNGAIDYWENFWSEYHGQWDNLDPNIRSKGLIATMQIAAQSYKGGLTAGTPTWITPSIWIRDMSWGISNIANIVPTFAKECLRWFSTVPLMAEHNSYTLDGVVKDLAFMNSTDSSAIFILAAAKVWENTHDVELFTALLPQLNSALEYVQTNYNETDKHILALHPHDYWDDYPLYGGEMDVSLVKYESFIDVLWAVALRGMTSAFLAIGAIDNATYCETTSNAIIEGLEDYRDVELGNGFHYAIKTDDTLYSTVIASPANIYASKFLNDKGARNFLTDFEVVSMLGMKNLKNRVALSFSNYRPAYNINTKGAVWGAHIPLVAGELAKDGNYSMLSLIKDSMPMGSWGEGISATSPATIRGLVKFFELAPMFTISLSEIVGLCDTLSKL